MTKLAIQVFVICQSLLMTFASDLDAQRKYLHEIEIDLPQYEQADLKVLINDIEERSNFEFAFPKKLVSGKTFNLHEGRWDMESLLKEISTQAHVSIRRINETISFSDVKLSQALPDVVESKIVNISISGIITDENGEALPGATVLEKGTTNGTITDFDGKYSLSVANEAIITVSFVGYQSTEVPVNGRSIIDISMATDVSSLDEVVVVGYGTQKKVNLTGSVEFIKGDAISKQPVTQVSQALVGLVPGLTAIQSSGQPGKDQSDLRVRGIGSIGASSSPLVVIDGVAGDINTLNPSDIEGISVLKDAAAAAIYGSRASNGVILITTKRAKPGKVSVNYSNYFGWQHINNQPEYLNAVDFMTYSGIYTQAQIDDYAANVGSDPDLYPDTDWIKELYTESGFRTQHNLSFSGGTENYRTMASISYNDESANIVNFNFKRVNARINTDIKLSEKFDINFNVNFVRSVTKEASAGLGLIVREVYRDYPNAAARHSDGSWGPGWYGDNGVANAHDGGNTMIPQNNFTSVLKVNYSPVKDLKFSVMYAPYLVDISTSKMRKQVATISDWVTKTYVYAPSRNEFSQERSTAFTHNFNALVTYDKTFRNHSLSALGGYEFLIYNYSVFGASRKDYILDKYEVLDAGSAATALNYGSATHTGLVSYFGRVNYSFKDKYLLEANIRSDASSRFDRDNQVGVFPSVSAGWRISEESFFQSSDFLYNLKLRASWGQLGNQQIGSDFPYTSTIALGGATTSNTAGYNYLFNNTVNVGAVQGVLANRDIRWETTETTNFGLDADLLNGKVNLSAEYYIRETKDILLQLPIPRVLGLSPSEQNAGNVKNSGVDASLGWQDTKGDFSYYARANFSTVKNEVTNLGGLANIITNGNSITTVGSPIGSIYGLESIGLFQSDAEIAESPAQFGTVVPGNIKYKDQLTVDTDNDGIADAADGIINANDRVIIGNPFPSVSYGLSLGANYKGWDISVSLIGVGKRDLLLQNYLAYPLNGKIQTWALTETWTPTNTGARYPLIEPIRNNDSQINDVWVHDASYLRVRNISLGYTIPNFANGLRVYFSGQNMFTFDKLHKGIDPLTPNGSTGDLFPIPSTYTFGISVQF